MFLCDILALTRFIHLLSLRDTGDLSHAKTYGNTLRLTLFVNGKGAVNAPSAQLQAELARMTKTVAALTDKLQQLEHREKHHDHSAGMSIHHHISL